MGRQVGGAEGVRGCGGGEVGALPAGDGAGAGGTEAGVRYGDWRLEALGRWAVGEGGQGVCGSGHGNMYLGLSSGLKRIMRCASAA